MRLKSVFRMSAVVLLGAATLGAQAQLPCNFSWKSAVVDGVAMDFTTPASSQPYQGPCMAFAFNSAIEIMYRIEHGNASLPISLNDAYLDYWVWNWTNTLPGDSLENIADGGCGNFPPNCDNELDCSLVDEVSPIIDAGDCFAITGELVTVEVDGMIETFWQYTVNPTGSQLVTWYSVGQFDQSLTFPNNRSLKLKIVNEGPVVLKVDGSKIENFRDYGGQTTGFHGYVVLGWRTVEDGTQWLLKDSWPGSAGFHYSKTDPGIVRLIDENYAWVYQVSQITANGQYGKGWPNLTLEAGCPPPPPPQVSVDLTCWDFGADMGGCATASGGTPPYSYQFQLTGTGGTLYPIGTNCVEIVGFRFNGSLYVTVTDSLGQTAWDSCSFSSGHGGGGPY